MRPDSDSRTQVVYEIEVASAIRIGFALSLALWAVVGVGLVALYVVGAVAGGLGGFRGFLASLGLTGAWANPITFLPVFAIAALTAAAATSAVAALVALLYNALTPIIGGLEVRSREGDAR
jgi:hypothetical protein